MSWSRSRKNGIKVDMKKPNLTRITVLLAMPAVMALLAGTSPAAQSAAAKKSADLPAAVETDPRLKPGGVYGFGFHQAKIIDPALPRVLLIGDSILDGYIRDVTASLNGKANVDFWENPYFQSEELNQLLGKVLGYGPYDAVHFNMGLHGWQKGRINLDPAVASCKKGRSAFVHTDFQLLRRVTLRVRSALPRAGCCAAGQTTKSDGLSYGRLRQLPDLGSRTPPSSR